MKQLMRKSFHVFNVGDSYGSRPVSLAKLAGLEQCAQLDIHG
jgi:hypothetical protein